MKKRMKIGKLIIGMLLGASLFSANTPCAFANEAGVMNEPGTEAVAQYDEAQDEAVQASVAQYGEAEDETVQVSVAQYDEAEDGTVQASVAQYDEAQDEAVQVSGAQYGEAEDEAVQVSGAQDYAAGDDVAYSSAVSSRVVQLKADVIGELKALNRKNEIVYSPEKNGLYFVQTIEGESYKYKITFYSIEDNSYKEVYANDEDMETVFVNEEAAYFIRMEYKLVRSYTDDAGLPAGEYDATAVIDKYDFASGTLQEIKLEPFRSYGYWLNLVTSFGVDSLGRYYIATCENELHLISPEGKELSKVALKEEIGEFYGFDVTNGNFYYRGEAGFNYWGTICSMASLKAGNVGDDNSLTVKNDNIMYLYQYNTFVHKDPVKLFNGRYLAALSTFNNDGCVLLDSHQYDINDVTESSSSINLINGGMSVSLINIANVDAIKLVFRAADAEYNDDRFDQTGYGPRCVMNDDGTTIIAKTDEKVLTEYDIAASKEKVNLETAHPVYLFFRSGDKVVVVEREKDKYYLEVFDWVIPKTFDVEAPSTMSVGTTGTVKCTADSNFIFDYTYKSSDSKIVSVDENGTLSAWKKGTVTITITAPKLNVKKSITITVTDSNLSKSSIVYTSTGVVGAASATMHKSTNIGYNYGSVQTAYLNALANGTFERVEYIRGYVVREIYDSSYRLLSQKKIKCELPLFGGFYSGTTYNYLVFGQNNLAESSQKEVIRVVKYDKNWKRLGICQIKGANTYIPFDAGGLDMTETAGKLYIHACHRMFQDENGTRHQTNCTFVVNEATMKLVDSLDSVSNISGGYVSHSFAQQIATDGKYVYRVDLGDAYPRGIAFTATAVSAKVSRPTLYGTLIAIPGGIGDNYTGFTLNDLKLGKNNYILTGTGLKNSSYRTRNIYINAGSKTTGKTGAIWITNYTSKDKTRVMNPKLVKLGDTQFLLMWEERNTQYKTYKTKMVLLDESGRKTSDIITSNVALSMCEPVVTRSGMVVWYVTNNDSPVFVQINPYQLAKVQEKTKNVSTFSKDNTASFDNTNKTGYRKGDIVFSGKMIYKVTSSSTVSFGGVTSNSIQALTIPSSVKLGQKVYKVTAVSTRALIYRTNLRKVTIGKGITRIGAAAFYGCKSLKYITINGTKLTLSTVGAKAFTGISPQAVITVPAGKKSEYKKLLLVRGVTKNMTVK